MSNIIFDENTPVYGVVYNSEEDGDLYGISPVDKPATGLEFIAMNEESEMAEVKLSADKPKQMLYGVVLRANQKIKRVTKDKEPFYLTFSAEVIERFAQDFLKKGYQHNATFNHQEKLNDVTVVESWIVEDPNNDKGNALGLNLQKGDWVIGQKLGDDSWTNYIENGVATGFSIDSYIQYEKINMADISATKNKNNEMSLLKKFLQFMKSENVAIDLKDVMVEGVGSLTIEGDSIWYTDTMEPFVGEFEFEGVKYVTNAEGKIVEEEEEQPEAEVEAPANADAELEVDVEAEPEADAPAEPEAEADANDLEKELADANAKIAELEVEIKNLTEMNAEVLKEVEVLKSKPVVSERLKAYESKQVINMRKVEKEESSTLSVIAELRKKNNK